jgi:hypothetical protein
MVFKLCTTFFGVMEKSAKQHYVEKPAEIKTTSTGQQAL